MLAVMAIGDSKMEPCLRDVIAPELLMVAGQISQELQMEGSERF